ncbi:DUF6809 family protein [Oscillibacter sp.]|uniref:DUF6809 family protein n=1 Tax=Oscillibacter sp. TaxID=1945593 RepID=UPI002D7F4CF7|nr:DUF6809 family protein [Oscillibacter sp.]
MQSLIDALYFHAQENQVSRYLQTAEYRRAIFGMEEGWEAFRSTLTAEQGERLSALLAQKLEVMRLEDEAVFRSGLSIGLTLGRL